MSSYTVDGMQISCDGDGACPYSSICYFPDKANPTQGLCGCDAEWGNIGLKCNQPSPQTSYRIVGFSVIIAVSSMVVLFIAHDLFEQIRTTGIKRLEVRATSLIAGMISLASLIGYCGFGIQMLQHPDDLSPFKPGQALKKRVGVVGRALSLNVFVFFFVAAILNVSILWLEVAVKSRKFKFISNPQVSYRYRIGIFVIDIILGILISVFNWINGSASSVGVAAMVIICLVYTYGAIMITKVFKEVSSLNEKSNEPPSRASLKMREALIHIRNCATQVVFCLLMWIACVAVTSVKYPAMRKNIEPRGQILDFTVLLDVGYLFAVFSIGATTRYLRGTRKANKSSGANNEEEDKASGKTGTGVVVPAATTDNETNERS